MGYFSIHNHTSYSNSSRGFPDSINMVKPLVDRALEIGLTGIVVTDHECLSAHVKLMHYRDELLENEIIDNDFKVGFGDEIYLVEELGPQRKYYHHLLIAKDKIGYHILRRSSTQAWENSFTDRGLVRTPITRGQLEKIVLEEGKGHIISSTACIGGELGQSFLKIKELTEVKGLQEESKEVLAVKQHIADFVEWNLKVFGEDFYIELAPNTSEEQRYVNRRLWTLAQVYGIKAVFSTDSHYLKEDDRELHKAYLNSKEAEREVDDFYYTAYMMTEDKVEEYFMLDFTSEEYNEMKSNLEDMKSTIQDFTLFKEQEIPLVEVVSPVLSPTYDTMDLSPYSSLLELLNSTEKQNLYWVRTCLNEMEKRNVLNDRYLKQLDTEAKTLVEISKRLNQPMTGYYNTAKKIVELIWTEGDSLVGISRGSAFGFMSNWLLDITQMDPVPYVGDLSWRHLSPSRPELPK